MEQTPGVTQEPPASTKPLPEQTLKLQRGPCVLHRPGTLVPWRNLSGRCTWPPALAWVLNRRAGGTRAGSQTGSCKLISNHARFRWLALPHGHVNGYLLHTEVVRSRRENGDDHLEVFHAHRSCFPTHAQPPPPERADAGLRRVISVQGSDG